MRPIPHAVRHSLPLLAGALLAGLAAWGCGAKALPSKVVVLTPPEVVATVPAPRSTSVPYDTPIHIDFAADMDASTMTASNVFLKLDTQRVPITALWNAGLRRLTVIPQAPLALRRTYTIEIGAGMRSADGGTFAAGGWFFQFGTNGARRPTTPRPHAGDSNESPFVMMSWDSTEISAGNISYEIWSGLDSMAVAARAGAPTATVTAARWLPVTAWSLGARIYWAITVVNATIGERFNGDVQSFATLPQGTAEDSLIAQASDYGYNYIIGSVSPIYPYQFCSQDSIVSTGGVQGWLWFPLSGLPANVHVASARLEVYTWDYDVSRLSNTVLTLWSSKNAWPRPCQPNKQFLDNLPNKDQPIATGRQESGRRLIYQSDLLAAHVEASVRRGGFYGYEFVSTQRMAYVTPHQVDPTYHPYIKIHYYRTPPEPAIAHGP